MSFDAHILSFTTLFDPELAEDFDASIDLRFGEDRFRAGVIDGRFEIERGEAAAPDATIEADVGHPARGGARPSRAGRVAGRRRGRASRATSRSRSGFLGLFPLPEPAIPVA